jgi:NRAMP (natural resistance-associated macrophage protein)-like metal ion transporter
MAEQTRPGLVRRFFSSLGPGLITGAADDDPSGIATYSLAGAQFGTSLLWMSFLCWPLMSFVQMMCARIGMCTGQGLSAAFRKKFPRWVIVLFAIALIIANTINVAADLSGMADAAQMITHLSSKVWVILFGSAIAYATVRCKYQQIAAVLKWLALTLFAYVIAAFIVGPNWPEVLHDAVIPSWPQKDAWGMIVAILGTTISPYLFYWQASEEVEEEKAKGRKKLTERKGASNEELSTRKLDVVTGAFFSELVMFFIILTTALTLHRNGITKVETSQQVADALKPLAGTFASLLYTVGILGVGFLAIPTLTGSSAYAFAEALGWKQGLDRDLPQAKHFYSVVIGSSLMGVVLNFVGVSPVKALYLSAVVNGLLAPFVMCAIWLVASDRKLMGDQPSSMPSRVVVGFTTLAMFAAAVAMFVV